MSKNATKEQWKELYELGKEFKKRKPWEKLANLDIVELVPEQGETVYMTVMGDGSERYGFSMYGGEEGLNKLRLLVYGEDIKVETEHIIYEQDCISMWITNRDEVSDEQHRLLRDLGQRFRGDGWIYFERFETGFFPATLTAEEVVFCTKYLKMFMESFGRWILAEPLKKEDLFFDQPLLTDDLLKQRLKQTKRCKGTWELDFYVSMQGIAPNDEGGKPMYSGLFLIVNTKDGMVIGHTLAVPDNYTEAGPQTLVNAILDYGRPTKIVTQNMLIDSMIVDVCDICDIKREIGYVPLCKEAEASFEDARGTNQIEKMFAEMGFDVEELYRMAGSMSEKEFSQMMMEAIENRFQDGVDPELFRQMF